MAPPGVDIGDYRPRSEPRPSEGPLVVGCVAHLLPVKGHPTLIDAVGKCPGMVLKLAGRPLDAEYVGGLKRQIEDLGIEDRVEFLGPVADVPSLHHELDVCVLPTLAEGRMEGCPVALLEAMSSGLPVIATAIPGAKDVIEHGVSGLLVPAKEPERLAEALMELKSEERRQCLGAGARERIEQKYSLAHEIATHETVYERLLTR